MINMTVEGPDGVCEWLCRMTTRTVRIMALIAAAQARIEGMKASNAEREANGYALAYDGDAFFEECRRLELLANEVIQQ